MSVPKPGKRPMRSLTAQEKLNAIRRVHDGESKASVARDIGVPESTLRGWCKNEQKISYQTRASPETDESNENHVVLPSAKRIKMDEQPYNLSMKSSESSSCTYSPTSENQFPMDYTKCNEGETENSPLNLRLKNETSANQIPNLKVSTNVSSSSDKDKEREKNRAELARLSAELGLNRPEVQQSNFNSSSNMNDITTLLFQWSNICRQQLIYQQQQKALQQPKVKTTTPTVDTSAIGGTNGLLTTVDKRDKILPISEQPSVYDSVSYWLKQQSLMGLNSSQLNTCIPNTSIPNTSAMPSVTFSVANSNNNGTSSFINNMSNDTLNQQLRFWNWYKQSTYSTQTDNNTVPILYQQLTKEVKDAQNTENYMEKMEEKPKNNSNKNRSVLDNLLLNNNINNTIDYNHQNEDVEGLSAQEAVEHGEKFLKWLESCSDPSVTASQLISVQTLVKNLKTMIDRKNGDLQSKAKGKRK